MTKSKHKAVSKAPPPQEQPTTVMDHKVIALPQATGGPVYLVLPDVTANGEPLTDEQAIDQSRQAGFRHPFTGARLIPFNTAEKAQEYLEYIWKRKQYDHVY